MRPPEQRTFAVLDAKKKLKLALELVEEIDPPEDLRGAVFSAAAALLAPLNAYELVVDQRPDGWYP